MEKKIQTRDEEAYLNSVKTLSEEQRIVFDDLLKHLTEENGYSLFMIEGYAGTGKTYLISKLVSCLNCKVAMSAPTNKAVKVLTDNRGDMDSRVIYSTIHKLLALRVKMQYPPAGSKARPKQILVKVSRKNPIINDFDLLIIDEASMLDDELFFMIEDEKKSSLKIIFMGDPAQIPPVNKDDSIPLIPAKREIYNIKHYELKTIMRQADGSKILETAYQIRNQRFQIFDPILSRKSNDDVLFFASSSEKDKIMFTKTMIEMFTSENFKNDPNYCKTIAWTNKVVDNFNLFIRKKLFKGQELKKIMVGEKLIADTPIFDGWEEFSPIIFNTSDEFEVIEYEEKTFEYFLPTGKEWEQELSFMNIEQGQKGKSFNLKYYSCVVESVDIISKEKFRQSIDVLHETAEKPFGWLISAICKRELWKEYEKLTKRFSGVKYNYAITAHKAQGSTYKNVFLIEDDIQVNPRVLERNRIKYTACTRPKEKLFILSKFNIPQEKQ